MATAAMLAAAPTATARARARGLGWKRCAIARSFSVPRWRPGASSRATPATTAALPSLTSESTWRLQFEFFSGRDPNATEPDRTVSAKVKFALDEGYERLQTPHPVRYACTACSEAKERSRLERSAP